jgi:hypothetical protein
MIKNISRLCIWKQRKGAQCINYNSSWDSYNGLMKQDELHQCSIASLVE